MKTTKWRSSIDFEKEENWLNQQVAEGHALTHYAFGRYTFEDCEPGEYIYRIELLEHLPGHPESVKYLSFLAEQGVEYICSWARWVYLRKKAADGPFDLYSDIDSRLAHYRRVRVFLTTLAYTEVFLAAVNLFVVFDNWDRFRWGLSFVASALCLALGAVIFIACHPVKRKIKELRREKKLRE